MTIPLPSPTPDCVSRTTHHAPRTTHLSRLKQTKADHASRITHHAPRLAFTLIEILIAMGILSMVLAAIYTTWTSILRASKVGLDSAASIQRARVAIRTLEESLDSVQSFALNPDYYALLSENGDSASLSFVARLSKSFPRSGRFGDMDVRRVTFSVESSPDAGRQLVLRQHPVVMDLDKDENEHPVVLAKNVRGFEAKFWDIKQNDWVDEWKPKLTNELPVMVKVTLKLAVNAQSTQVHDEITRIISLPTSVVQAVWQRPGGLGPTTPPIMKKP
jgi:type II secretion system protein J